jgi:hypothetical protein
VARETRLDGDGHETIQCYQCGEWKLWTEFYSNSKKRGGFSTKCRVCELASRKQKYDALTPEEKQAYARKQTAYQRQRAKTPDAIENQREQSAKYLKDEAGGWIKRCAACGNWMSMALFYDDLKKPGGCSVWCKACIGQKKLIQTENITPEQKEADRIQLTLPDCRFGVSDAHQ